ncbi:MAG: hypothetical protein ACO3D2_04055 [Holophagaceae bacterium]
MRKNTLIPVVACLMVSLLSGQDPVTSSSNFKDLPPVPRTIIEPPPLPSIKTSPKDLRRKTRVIKKKKTKSKKKSNVPRKVKVAR